MSKYVLRLRYILWNSLQISQILSRSREPDKQYERAEYRSTTQLSAEIFSENICKNTEIICISKDPDLRLMTVNKSYSQKLNVTVLAFSLAKPNWHFLSWIKIVIHFQFGVLVSSQWGVCGVCQLNKDYWSMKYEGELHQSRANTTTKPSMKLYLLIIISILQSCSLHPAIENGKYFNQDNYRGTSKNWERSKGPYANELIYTLIFYNSFDQSLFSDEDAFYGKIGRILNQLDVAEINNEIETENRKIENEFHNYFGSNLKEDRRWVSKQMYRKKTPGLVWSLSQSWTRPVCQGSVTSFKASLNGFSIL